MKKARFWLGEDPFEIAMEDEGIAEEEEPPSSFLFALPRPTPRQAFYFFYLR